MRTPRRTSSTDPTTGAAPAGRFTPSRISRQFPRGPLPGVALTDVVPLGEGASFLPREWAFPIRRCLLTDRPTGAASLSIQSFDGLIPTPLSEDKTPPSARF